jgi:hypothetical protein
MNEKRGGRYDIVLTACMEQLDTNADLILVDLACWPWEARIRAHTPPLRLALTLVVLIAAVIGFGDTSTIEHCRWMLTGPTANAGGTVPPQGSLPLEQTKIDGYTHSSESGSRLRINPSETPQGPDRYPLREQALAQYIIRGISLQVVL